MEQSDETETDYPALMRLAPAERATYVAEVLDALCDREDAPLASPRTMDFLADDGVQRDLAERLDLPYLVIRQAIEAHLCNPAVAPDDIAALVRWCETYTPERAAWRALAGGAK